jgi:hypothetical protein
MSKQKMPKRQNYILSGWRSRLQLLLRMGARMRSEASLKILLISTQISVARKIAAARRKSNANAKGRNEGGLECQKKMIASRARDIARQAQSALIERWRKGS